MNNVRRSEDRGKANLGWLDSRHSFSFGNYFDSEHMGFGPLRVINEDRVKPAQGFDTHGHRDMEIITYLLEGALQHEDSMGNGSIIKPGDVQRMTAGPGVTHSEHNASSDEDVHLLQIWIEPAQTGLEPGYQQIAFTPQEKRNQLRLVGSQDGRNGSLVIHQDVDFYATILEAGHRISHSPQADRRLWLQVVRGEVEVDGQSLAAGDGIAIEQSAALTISAISEAEVLLFDMARGNN